MEQRCTVDAAGYLILANSTPIDFRETSVELGITAILRHLPGVGVDRRAYSAGL